MQNLKNENLAFLNSLSVIEPSHGEIRTENFRTAAEHAAKAEALISASSAYSKEAKAAIAAENVAAYASTMLAIKASKGDFSRSLIRKAFESLGVSKAKAKRLAETAPKLLALLPKRFQGATEAIASGDLGKLVTAFTDYGLTNEKKILDLVGGKADESDADKLIRRIAKMHNDGEEQSVAAVFAGVLKIMRGNPEIYQDMLVIRADAE